MSTKVSVTATKTSQKAIKTTQKKQLREPVTEPVTEPVKEPVTEPVKEPVTETVRETVREPVTEPVTETVTETVNETLEESNVPSFKQRIELLVQSSQSHMLILKSQIQELRRLQRDHEILIKEASKKNKKKRLLKILRNQDVRLDLQNQSL